MAYPQQFEIYPDPIGQWRWRFRAAGNGEIISSGEGYVAIADCEKAVRLLQQQAPAAKIEYLEPRVQNALNPRGLMTSVRSGLLG